MKIGGLPLTIIVVALLHACIFLAIQGWTIQWYSPEWIKTWRPRNFYAREIITPNKGPAGGSTVERQFTLPTEIINLRNAEASQPSVNNPPRSPEKAVIGLAGKGNIPLPGLELSSQLFGISSQGRSVIYLLDVSGSMLEPASKGSTRLDAARLEIMQSLRDLKDHAQFNIVLFADKTATFASQPVPATPRFKAEAMEFLKRGDTRLGGSTDIANGLGSALQQGADCIYLITDGMSNVPESMFRAQISYFQRKSGNISRINSIGFFLPPGGEEEHFLKSLAADNGGQFVNWKSNQSTSR